MKSRLPAPFGKNARKKLLGIASALLLFAGAFGGSASARSASSYEALIDGVLSWKMAQTGTSSAQALIDSGLSPKAGTGASEWYVIALRQYKNNCSYSAYTAALDQKSGTLESAGATDRQRVALAYSATGGNAAFVQSTIDGAIGKNGVMSYVYGLILLDSNAYTNTPVSRDEIVADILSLELSDGGWALRGTTSDVDVTAMALQALAPYAPTSAVKPAVDRALSLLSVRQLDGGDYTSWGTRNAESTAQVLAAASALNLDWETDGRFIKNGHTLLDGLLDYRLPDGSFSHAAGGVSNDVASVQALYSLVGAWRRANGLGPLFQFTSETGPRGPGTTSSSAPAASGPGATASPGPQASGGTPASGEEMSGASDVSDVSSEPVSSDFEQAPTATWSAGSTAAPAALGTQTKGGGYKGWACLAVGVLALIAAGVLFLTKKNNKKNFLLLLGVTAAAMLAVLLTNIQSVGQYYAAGSEGPEPGGPSVTVSIRCDTVAGQRPDLPADGCILDSNGMSLQEGDTVFDVLVRAAQQNKIQLDYEGEAGSVYVKGIQYLYEKQFGDTSGWMYKVNGQFVNVGCSDYKLADGDVVEWMYTCDLGRDVGADDSGG